MFAGLEGGICLYVAFRFFQASADLRRMSWWWVLAMVPLVLAGVVLDALPFPLAEQIGEMAAMSLLLYAVHWQYTAHNSRSASASDRR